MKNNKVTQDNLDITWQDFSDHVTNLNSELVKNERFADVILVSDDLVEFKAQKVILSGCSLVVSDILKNDTEYIHLQRNQKHYWFEIDNQFLVFWQNKHFQR